MRRPLSTKARLALFLLRDGMCHICQLKIMPGQLWDIEHVLPLAMGGEDGGDNLQLAHVDCHRAKSKREATERAKADRVRAIHLGAKAKTSRPIPGSKASGWKMKMDGTVVRRER